MEHLESKVKTDIQSIQSSNLLFVIAIFHHRFNGLQIDISKILLPEVVLGIDHSSKPKVLVVIICLLNKLTETSEDPFVS